jgi:hypothetical protein
MCANLAIYVCIPKKYIYRLIHGHFHIGLVIIPRPPYWPETESRPILARANMGLDIEMIL